jgi:hypothetical protein
VPWSVRGFIPTYNLLRQTLVCVSVICALSALWVSWHRSRGTARQRLGWIGVCMGAVYAVSLFEYLVFGIMGFESSGPVVPIFDLTVMLLAYCGFAYAMLRHRLFDFGFAINRALVFTIISTMLLLAFSFTEWSVDKLLHFEGREKNVVVDAFVALGIILSFHRIQHWVHHKVDHTFFHHWYEAAEKLRHFLDKAAHISDAMALQEKFILAVEEFSGTSGCAIYAVDKPGGSQGGFHLCHSTLDAAPARIGANDNAVLDIRHSRDVVDLGVGKHDLPGELVFPMTVRAELIGMVLLGSARSGRNYRPDEISLLANSVRQLGMDLETLRMEELERKATALEQKAAIFEQKSGAFEREATALRQILNGERQIQPITQ